MLSVQILFMMQSKSYFNLRQKKKDNIVTVSLSPDILAYDDRLFPLSEIIKNEKAWVSHVDELDIDSGL